MKYKIKDKPRPPIRTLKIEVNQEDIWGVFPILGYQYSEVIEGTFDSMYELRMDLTEQQYRLLKKIFTALDEFIKKCDGEDDEC